MIFLPDVNVLIALAWPNHLHHGVAHSWFAETIVQNGEFWATSPLTQLAFVRISSNPRIIDEAVSPEEALNILERYSAHPSHRFWSDDVPVSAFSKLPASMLQGHRQVSDAHLILLAKNRRGTLVTFDRALAASVQNTDFDNSVLLLENSVV
ncbi:hypothetical protein B4O97_04925 [Marispirochaeta aestuarii]|uniref:Ribonuclease VapC n=1 Tax=Marispirochaeta aestuarii TaxID=1963862 RepID=A0A1Y1S0T8_9SPIO|nr:TA system VapC family ribonuclease toxin [Marispirochaeta aestuarii]ORC36971.1 hypothetical protein B4O97_04925 [Marispirochaeta aestuarii]